MFPGVLVGTGGGKGVFCTTVYAHVQRTAFDTVFFIASESTQRVFEKKIDEDEEHCQLL